MKRHLLVSAAVALAFDAPLAVAAPISSSRGGACASRLEAAVLATVNRARAHPHAFAATLRPEYDPAANREAVRFLDDQASIAPLACDSRLAASARTQLADQGRRGGLSHIGSDGSTAMQRMQRRHLFASIYAEVISAGFSDPNGVVSQLIIDPPGPRHDHRTDLFDPALKAAGVACGPNETFGTVCVIDLPSRPMSPGGEYAGA